MYPDNVPLRDGYDRWVGYINDSPIEVINVSWEIKPAASHHHVSTSTMDTNTNLARDLQDANCGSNSAAIARRSGQVKPSQSLR